MNNPNENDIAIVGLALRVPGASTPEEYWANLCGGVESLQQYTEQELIARGVPAATLADPNYIRAGMPLQGMEQFDPEFFGFSPKEAAILDPQHRQFYEVAWEALERAGHPPEKFDGNIAVFAGCGMGAYFAYNILTNRDLLDSVGLFLLRHTGNDKDFLSTRVSYSFNLRGPSVNVQTACSTSLVAAHMAVQSLLARECDMALAGGVTIEVPHQVGYHYKEGEILSPDGHCRAFDHRSKGTVFGSGAGVVVLRRLADALADGDHIHAVIKASAINNDGSAKVGFLAPSVDGQAAAAAEAIALSGVEADSIGYIECHGTGTPVGDPIEIAALTQAFRESTEKSGFCYVGSVKSNIGHLDTAAGVASLIKTALAVEHGRIPPSLNYEAPNPGIGFDGSPFKVADRLVEWNGTSAPRRAAVNSLGVGGTNAFIVLEQPPGAPPAEVPARDAQPLVLSARNRRALDDGGARLAKWLRANPSVPLADISWTLFQGRHAFEHRRVLAAASHEEAAALLESGDARRVFNHTADVEKPSVVFMFPGGGAQYFQMGCGLYDGEPVFREHMDRGLRLLREKHAVDLAPVFLAKTGTRETTVEHLNKPSVQLPLIFLIEYALTKLWEYYGVSPAAVLGHSMGENTAACVAGVISFEDALGLVLLRGQLMDEVPEGAMLSVSMPAQALASMLDEGLDLATSNSPQLSVASGPAALIDALAARLNAQEINHQRVRINIAAHSRMLDGILGRFRDYLRSIRLDEPRLLILSNRTGQWLPPGRARDPEYWVEHLRNTVLFADNVQMLLERDDRVFLEVGPGNTLSSFVRQNPKASAQRVFSSLRHPDDTSGDDVYLRAVIARLWAVGVPVKLDVVWKPQRRRVPMPTYPFQHQSYWIAPGIAAAQSTASDERPMRLTGPEDWFSVPRWVQQGVVELDEAPATWLVFQLQEPVADTLVQWLRQRGDKVVRVLPGDAFTRVDDSTFTIAPEAGGVGYEALVSALAADSLLPDKMLHGWLLTWDQSFRPGSTFFHRNQEYGFYSLLHLAQALGKAGATEKPLQLIVTGNGLLRVAGEDTRYPDKATVLGPVAVIPREFPGIQCRFLDVVLPQTVRGRGRKEAPRDPSSAVAALEAELAAAGSGGVFAWRDGVRWQRHVSRWSEARTAARREPRVREAGVYLITGGLGGIAGVVAEWLAREHRARLVLLGRSPLPRREDWNAWIAENGGADPISRSIERIRALEALGAQVLPVAADVAVAERMQEVVEEVRTAFGQINGVFHAAGVIRDNLIQLKSQRDIEDVFSAKLWGTLVLDRVFAEAPLDFMVLFSSTSSFIAPQGQVDYVGANSFLNAFADARAGARSYPVIALNWGVWKGVGMVGGPAAAGDAHAHEIDAAHAVGYQTVHPLFERHLSSREGVDAVHWFEGALSAARDWVIDEHRLASGNALLPGTGYLELIRAALAEVGVERGWQVGNLVFQNPLFVPDDAPRTFRLSLRGDSRRWEVGLFAHVPGPTASQSSWQGCATARITLPEKEPPAPLDLAAIEARCTAGTQVAGGTGVLRSRQEDHLHFGPRFRPLKRLSLGRGEALAQLELADTFASDLTQFALHPGLLDIATGFAMDLIPGYASHEVVPNLWAPLLYRALRFHAPLQAQVVSWVRLSPTSAPGNGVVAFDVVIADPAGNVLVEVDQLTLRRIDGALAPVLPTAAPTTSEGAPLTDKARPPSPGELALRHNVSQGIDAANGVRGLVAVLSAANPPSTVVFSSMELAALTRQIDSLSRATITSVETRFTRPQLDNDFEAPRDELEIALAGLWGKLLGVEGVGIRDSFFDLGGHSLIAVRLFNEISDKYSVDLPMSVLMQSPTIGALAELIRAESPAPAGGDAPSSAPASRESALKYHHLVPMHSATVADRTPLFIVAGMFGNVLNLSHLAHIIGDERPFYALQARGLYGDAEPHETFEEAARDYIAEIRMVQPHGPYLLGGFSGGGVTAYEMACQLIAAGEEVPRLIMLDTPIPEFPTYSFADKLSMLRQGLQRDGLRHIVDKINNRIETAERARENAKPELTDKAQFQSRRIGVAFIRALHQYRVPQVPVDVALFRPKLDIRYRLSGGRILRPDTVPLHHDNGWTPFVRSIEVTEVPGNHDSMVLEPNVRVLAAYVKRAIQGSPAATGPRIIG